MKKLLLLSALVTSGLVQAAEAILMCEDVQCSRD
jgi:hypothetical protein